MKRLKQFINILRARIDAWLRERKDPHQYEFSLRQTAFISTDLGRTGVVRGRRYDAMTDTESYLIEREHNRAKEWYPRMSLCVSKDQISEQPTTRSVPLTAAEAAQFAARRVN